MSSVAEREFRAENPPFYFTVHVPGKSVVIFDVSLGIHGDLIITAATRKRWRSNPSSPITSTEISNSKISVHPTNKSPDGNLLTFETTLADGSSWRRTQFTKAFKSCDRFSALYARMLSDIRHDLFENHLGTENLVCIGAYDPAYISMAVVIYVTRRDVYHTSEVSGVFRSRQLEIGGFRIVVAATFINLPSTAHASILLYPTSRSDAEEDIKQTVIGFEQDAMHDNSLYMVNRLIDNYFSVCNEILYQNASQDVRDAIFKISNSDIYLKREPVFGKSRKTNYSALVQDIINDHIEASKN